MLVGRRHIIAVLAAVAVLAAACGGSEPGESEAEPAPQADATSAVQATQPATAEGDAGSPSDPGTSTPQGEAAADCTGESHSVTIALPALGAPYLAIYSAIEEGFFEDHGVEAEIILTPGPAATIAAVASDSADVGLPFAEQGLAAIEVGAPIKIFAGVFNRVLGRLIGTPSYSGIEDLRGTQIASSAPDDLLTLLTKEKLAVEGLAEDQYDMIVVPSSEQRYQTLQSGAVGASVLVAPRDNQAISEGFPVVFDIEEPGVLTAHFGSERFIEERTAAAVCYVRAIQEAQNWMLESGNRDRAVEILAASTEVPTEVAAATYDTFIEVEGWVPDALIVEEDLQTTLDYLLAGGKIFEDPPDPEKYATTEILELAAQ